MILVALVGWALAQEPPPAPARTPGTETAREHELQERIRQLEHRLEAVETKVGPDRRLSPSDAQTAEPGVRYSGPLIVEIGERLERAVAFGGPIDVKGAVLGDAVSVGSDIVVRSTGVVEGNAVSVGGRIVVEPGGNVEGDQVALGRGAAVTSVAGVFADGSPQGVVRGFFRQLSVLSCLMGAGVLLLGLWPQNVERVARPLGDRPFWYGIAGAILTGCFGFGSSLLAVTVVGAPLALLLTLLLAMAWLLGVVAFCKAIGERFHFTEGQGAWASFLVGAMIVGGVSLVPYVGPLLVVLVGFPAVGAALLTRLGNRRVVT